MSKELDYMEYSTPELAQAAYVSNAVISNPVSHYKMNDNVTSTTVIDSMGVNNGTAQQNTSVLHTTGKIDGALSFIFHCDTGEGVVALLTYSAWACASVSQPSI